MKILGHVPKSGKIYRFLFLLEIIARDSDSWRNKKRSRYRTPPPPSESGPCGGPEKLELTFGPGGRVAGDHATLGSERDVRGGVTATRQRRDRERRDQDPDRSAHFGGMAPRQRLGSPVAAIGSRVARGLVSFPVSCPRPRP